MQTVQLSLRGATCGGCANNITKEPTAIISIENVIVSLPDGN